METFNWYIDMEGDQKEKEKKKKVGIILLFNKTVIINWKCNFNEKIQIFVSIVASKYSVRSIKVSVKTKKKNQKRTNKGKHDKHVILQVSNIARISLKSENFETN